MRDPTTIQNERVKLFAGFVNAISLGLIGLAVLRPLTANPSDFPSGAIYWGLAGLALHGFAHYILGRLRRTE